MLLLHDARLEDRRRAAATDGPLAPLFDSLASEIEPLLDRAPFFPEAKALLSRAGGRCERDGSVLDFDPWSPDRHRCPICGTVYSGEVHHRAWVTSYQLWLAERSVHGALFHRLRGDERHASLAREIIRGYAERYLGYPNRDNVLGPTRLFFSTYLESIWLLQIAVAADLLEDSGDTATADLARDRIIEPSRELIAEFDEGMSNRQVWNNAALLASAVLCGDAGAVRPVVEGPSGLLTHLSNALLADGTWYEGENYHQFALRGLWYCVTLCETHHGEIPRNLLARFHRAFAVPYISALPDFTMPSRKDSQYAVSLRQWRMAELAELGFARGADPLLAGALARCYEQGHERRATGRAHSTADVERNGPSSALTRADLGWRALLHAAPTLPEAWHSSPRSALLEAQGLAVFRRDGDVYVGVEFGQSGGGHGHPDRLNLTLYQAQTRWLDDLGTGSYVDPSLHWYRSTLAHNAPLIDGHSQPLRDGALLAHDEREGLGWIVAEFRVPQTDIRLERAIVVAPDYLIDELRWTSPRDVRVELPWHLDADIDTPAQPSDLDGGSGLEDGFGFVSDVQRVEARDLVVAAADDGRRLNAAFTSDTDVEVYAAKGPGQPASRLRRFLLLRATAREGTFRSVLNWSGDIQVEWKRDAIRVAYRDGETHQHRRDATGWHAELLVGPARSTIDLAGFRPTPDLRQAPRPAARNPVVLRGVVRADTWFSDLTSEERANFVTFELGEAHYRRSEDSWLAAGAPRATIVIGATSRGLVVDAVVHAEALFVSADATNALDNEPADTMGAGLQLYARSPDGSGAWMLVPEPGRENVRVRVIKDWGSLTPPSARWRPLDEGYEVRIELDVANADPSAEYPIDLDLIVNETTSLRQRRRGQLVMSGAVGEFVYLRGDRHEMTRLIPLVLVP